MSQDVLLVHLLKFFPLFDQSFIMQIMSLFVLTNKSHLNALT